MLAVKIRLSKPGPTVILKLAVTPRKQLSMTTFASLNWTDVQNNRNTRDDSWSRYCSDLGNWRDEQQEFSSSNRLNALDLQHEVLNVPATVICPTVCLELWPASPGKTTDV